jgi:hypothetical protein
LASGIGTGLRSYCPANWFKFLNGVDDKEKGPHMLVQTIDSEARLNRFNRLMQELIRGAMNRNTFQPWEIDILLDIEACQMREPVKRETLRRYQKAVQRSMEKGAQMPLRLSEYLSTKKSPPTPTPPTKDAAASEKRLA